MIRRLSLVIIIFFVVGGTLHSQEEVRNIQGNLVLQRIASQPNKSRLKAAPVDTIELPFIDDFSSTAIFPNQLYWADSNAYINSYMAKNILSIGVATLDNINSQGFIHKNASTNPFRADSLTSNPINLNYLGRNDVWLSFLYQPQGNIDDPEPEDSLFLEFYSPKDSIWHSIWDTCGFSSTVFKQQMVHITDSNYLQKGFRFRFRNLASIKTSDVPGSVGIQDSWHLDYIRLDTGRYENDTIIRDVAFIKPLTSFLKTYQSMPWNHFLKAYVHELNGSTDVIFRNNDAIDRYIYSKFFIFKEQGATTTNSFSIGGDSISPGISFNLQAEFKNPFTSTTEDTTVYDITSYLVTDNYDLKWNDTIHFQQIFNKYFAYDDGSAETGFGLSGEGTANGMYACSFDAFVTDTLRAIDIYFNPTYNNVNKNYSFKLAVWEDNKGVPGKLLYLSANDLYPDETKMHQFNTYWLDTVIVVSGKFYIGWKQFHEDFLNIGYDLNTDRRLFLFKNTNGTWVKPGDIIAPGALMIRPNLMKNNKTVDIPNIYDTKDIRVYPNPVKNYLTLANTDGLKIEEISIYNSIGQLVLTFTRPQTETFDVSHLKSGVYILKIVTEKGSVLTSKMIKEK